MKCKNLILGKNWITEFFHQLDINKWLVIATLLFMTAGRDPLSAQDIDGITVTSLTSQAYSLLESDPHAAELLLLYISRRYPTEVNIKRQLGYLYTQKKEYAKAYNFFTAAEYLSQSDTISLQIAYCLVSLNRHDDAEKILNQLQTSRYPDIRESAGKQISATSGEVKSSQWWTRIYSDPYYDTRWNSFFYYAVIEQGYSIDKGKILNGYGFLNLSGDSRSTDGLVPEIFSDNAIVTGLGLSVRPLRGLQFNAQYGLSFDLVKRADNQRVAGDFRSVLIYNGGIFPNLNLHDDVRIPFTPLVDIYSSLGYYSRYKNGIGYIQARAGARILEVWYSAGDMYLKGSVTRDIEKEFYNNQIDGAIGLRLTPDVRWGLYFAAEFHRGYYWNVGTSYNPYDRYFSSFHFSIIFERKF